MALGANSTGWCTGTEVWGLSRVFLHKTGRLCRAYWTLGNHWSECRRGLAFWSTTLANNPFSAKHGLAIACCMSVCLSVTLVDGDQIGWNSSEIIAWLVSLGVRSLQTQTSGVYSKGNTPKCEPKVTHPLLIWASETFDRKLRPNGYR